MYGHNYNTGVHKKPIASVLPPRQTEPANAGRTPKKEEEAQTMKPYTLDDLARLVDHTNLHPDATRADMEKLCDEAKRYHFKMVAINSVQSKLCSELLAGTDIDTGAAIGFPLGQTTIATKVFETKDALANGANEIDYVVNLTEVKAGNWDYIRDEMTQIVEVCREAGVPSKVIFENCLLTED